MKTSSTFPTRTWLLPLLLLSLTRGDQTAGIAGASARARPSRASAPDQIGPKKASEAYGKVPMSFEANQGQTNPEVKFLSRGPGYSLFLTPGEAVLAVRRPAARGAGKHSLAGHASVAPATSEVPPAVIRMKLIGANPPGKIIGVDPLPGKSNYFIGNDPKKWRTGVPTYARVRYRNVYAGVDLVYHGKQGQLEYDFVVAPGADASVIRVAFPGVDAIRVDASGDLLVRLAGEEVRQHKPVVYQDVAGVRRRLSSAYALKGDGEVGFNVAEHDASRPLVIDPVLVYSTYLGGSGSELGFNVGSVAVDAAGSAYVTGWTTSTDFPATAGAFQTTSGGGTDPCVNCDAFVSKLDPTGSALAYSTYFGGSGSDVGSGVAVDVSGNAFIVGGTDSPDLPTTPGVLDPTCELSPVGRCVNKGFVAKLDTSGSVLVYSTYLGPRGDVTDTDIAAGRAVAVDGAGDAYVIGNTGPGFPVTPGAFQAAYGGGQLDGFVAKLDAAGSSLVYSSFLGGGGLEQAAGIAIDGSGNAYGVGSTDSSDFPTTAGAFQRTCPFYQFSPGGCSMAFVTKIDASGSALVYSTYLGGDSTNLGGGWSQACGVAAGELGDAYVTGTAPDGFPTTPGAFQTTFGGGGDDAFVAKLNTTGAALMYSTYLGGSSEDGGQGIAVDASGSAYVGGWTWSTDFPVASAVQPTRRGVEDAFVARLNAVGSGVTYSTYLGGAAADMAQGVAVDPAGGAYIMGGTASTDFPTVNPLQSTFGGGLNDYFVAKIGVPSSCAEEVTDRVDVFRSRFYWIPLTPFRLQWVVIRNRTADPIQGPLAYVMEELQNARFLGSRLETICLSPSGDPFIVIHAGREDVLGPGERVLAFLLFFKTHPGQVAYTPRVLSGIPTQ